MTQVWKKYVFWYAQEHTDFRLSEFNSLVKMFDLPYKKSSEESTKPVWIVEFHNDEAVKKFASRSIGLRAVLELWSHGKDFDAFHNNLKQYIGKHKEDLSPYFKRESSFKINVFSYNKHFTHNDKVKKIESMDYLPLKGNVNLKSPCVEWWYIEYWGLDPNNMPAQPEDIVFGRWLANGQRNLIQELSLKTRTFIGTTSMDAQLSLLMANQALVKRDDLVFDPFVGSGSLLVSAAKLGAYVLGADINFLILHGKAKSSRINQKFRLPNQNVLANLQQYNCAHRYLDVVIADFSHSLWHKNFKLDSIITDPPYGIREATSKIQLKTGSKHTTCASHMPHYPSTSHYSLYNLYKDLLIFAAEHLKIFGRLVFWLPLHREDYTEDTLPYHPNLKLVSNSEQVLSAKTCRRLLTYEKHSEPNNLSDEEVIVHKILEVDFRNRYFSGREERLEKRKIEMKPEVWSR